LSNGYGKGGCPTLAEEDPMFTFSLIVIVVGLLFFLAFLAFRAISRQKVRDRARYLLDLIQSNYNEDDDAPLSRYFKLVRSNEWLQREGFTVMRGHDRQGAVKAYRMRKLVEQLREGLDYDCYPVGPDNKIKELRSLEYSGETGTLRRKYFESKSLRELSRLRAEINGLVDQLDMVLKVEDPDFSPELRLPLVKMRDGLMGARNRSVMDEKSEEPAAVS